MFVDRENELNLLESEFAQEKFRFCVIYGRRRVGKTTLIKEFIKNKKHIYFLATLESEKILLEKFKSIVSDVYNDDFLRKVEVKSFEEIFRYLASKNEKIVVVIDEFQYLARVNPAISSIFQNIIDNLLKNTKIFLILCGSIISLMYKETLSYSSPLYGRRTSNIKLKSLYFENIKYFFKNRTKKELVELYSVFYGIPKYLEALSPKKDIFDTVRKNILNKDSFLYNEPYFLLNDEINESITYFSILELIALGSRKIGEIASKMGKKENNITSFLQKLMDLELVYKEVPITEENPAKSKKGLYYIRDNFIAFWFRYVFPYRSQLEIGNVDYVMDKLRISFSEYVSKTFEDLAIEFTLKRFGLKKCGRWWDKNTEIDLVGFSDEFIIFGECKWSDNKVGINVYEELVKKSSKINTNLPKKYILFSKSGWSSELLNVADKNDLYLVTVDEI